MSRSVLTYVLLVAVVFAALLAAEQLRPVRLWGDHTGYEPLQPIAFSHRLHAGEMQISCLYCHSSAEQSRHAGIPPASTCMNCHQFVTAPLGVLRAEDERAEREGGRPEHIISPEIAKIYEAMGLDEELAPDPARQPQLIEWTRVYRLPDYVYFDHRAHVAAGISCQSCHGPVETMDRVRQAGSLSMGWCVNCHRDAGAVAPAARVKSASLDCATCHY
jgi:hypothetical protein